jgi:hypothetical protein
MPEPKKETIRIALPQRTETTHGQQHDGAGHDALRILKPTVPAPAIGLGKTQLPITGSEIVRTLPVVVAPSGEIDPFDSLPRWFCWGLLCISALIFLIQIWNYTLS